MIELNLKKVNCIFKDFFYGVFMEESEFLINNMFFVV